MILFCSCVNPDQENLRINWKLRKTGLLFFVDVYAPLTQKPLHNFLQMPRSVRFSLNRKFAFQPFFVALLLLSFSKIQAQDSQWWVNNVKWDGVSNWSVYLHYAAGLMGPNSLPVPAANDGRVARKYEAEILAWGRNGGGDKTLNAELRMRLPFGSRADLSMRYVPVEYYQVTYDTKTLRNVFFLGYDKTTAAGDLYVDGNFQVFTEEKNKVDLCVRSGVKTASGTARDAARHTDTPGYYFDAGFSKTLLSHADLSLRAFGSAGFYSYQTGIPELPQNDALMYSLGAILLKSKWEFQLNWNGYQGYFDEPGDKPMVVRAAVFRQMNSFRLGIRGEAGLQDYPFPGGALSAGWIWGK